MKELNILEIFMKMKKWWEVYPKNTAKGDEERRFFIALSRNPKYEWRSVKAIADEAKLTQTRTEEIVEKYANAGMIFQNSKNPDQWGYWERVKPELDGAKTKNVVQKDQDDRVKTKKAKP